MASYALTNAQARRFILRRLGLLGPFQYKGRPGVLGYLRHCNTVQVDPLDICGKNADLVLFSRVAGYKKPMLDSLLYKDHSLFEYHDKCLCIHPVADWPCFAPLRGMYSESSFVQKSLPLGGGALRAALQNGPLAPGDIDLGIHLNDWPGWNNKGAPLASATLVALYYTGEVTTHHRKGTQRVYALVKDTLPAAVYATAAPFGEGAELDTAAFYEWWLLRRIEACGLLWNRGSGAYVGMKGFTAARRSATFAALVAQGRLLEVNVEGIAHPLYCAAADEPLLREVLDGTRWPIRCEVIAPLDSLIWDRKLVEALFGFAYKWEVYTPVAQRRYGHYVVPVLWGERFIGRAELLRDAQSGTLRVANFWAEAGVRRTKRLDAALYRQLLRLARFHGLESVGGYEESWHT